MDAPAIRNAGLLLAALVLMFLQGCSDYVANALEITGEAAQNRRFSTEGVWEGRFGPASRWTSQCMMESADIRLEARGAAVVGQVVTNEGERFDVRGDAYAGASWTGLNSILARLYVRSGAERGYVDFVPGDGPDHMRGRYAFRQERDGQQCYGTAILRRVSP
jgi:hypothetical protein